MPLRRNLGFNKASGTTGIDRAIDRRASIAADPGAPIRARPGRIGDRRSTTGCVRDGAATAGREPPTASVRCGIGSGGRIRTTDQGLMSPLLYH